MSRRIAFGVATLLVGSRSLSLSSEPEPKLEDDQTPAGYEFQQMVDLATHAAIQEILPPKKMDVRFWRPSPDGDASLAMIKNKVAAFHRDDGEEMKAKRSKRIWIFGSHHKSGTVLLRHLIQYQARALDLPLCVDVGCFANRCTSKHHFTNGKFYDERIWFGCSMWGKELQGVRALAKENRVNLRGVHIIRDPLALVVSGYLYHMHSLDHLYNDMKIMRNISIKGGLAIEADFVLRETLKEMISTYNASLDENGVPIGDVLQVRLEDFMRSSDDYDATVKSMYDWTVGDIVDGQQMTNMMKKASRHDLHRHPFNHSTTEGFKAFHVADDNMKKKAEALLNKIPEHLLKELHAARRLLGYA